MPPRPGGVVLEPSRVAITPREIADGVNFLTEYEQDIIDGWQPVKQKGYIVAMERLNPDGESETKPPGHGNPLPPRSRSLSVQRALAREDRAPPVFERQHFTFQYLDGCAPAKIRSEKGRTAPPSDEIVDVEIRHEIRMIALFPQKSVTQK